jgi:hypothetical protein
MLNKAWKPAHMGLTEDKGDKIAPPADGYISQPDAERMMIIYQSISEEWADHLANATFYKEDLRFKKDALYHIAFLRSNGKSDRQKDVDAKSDPEVRMAEAKLIEAGAALKLAELRYDGAVRAYHACKRIMETGKQEKYL